MLPPAGREFPRKGLRLPPALQRKPQGLLSTRIWESLGVGGRVRGGLWWPREGLCCGCWHSPQITKKTTASGEVRGLVPGSQYPLNESCRHLCVTQSLEDLLVHRPVYRTETALIHYVTEWGMAGCKSP